MPEREPDRDTIAEQEIESRLDEYGHAGDDIIKDADSLADWDIAAEGGSDD